ncbi:MAG: hypothetical protein QOE37_1841 [Microbacteriaceae bacterium]|nr:hypothetical protein [Microbacteriaceae bacterium]
MTGVLSGPEAPPRRVQPRHRAGSRAVLEGAGVATALTLALVAVAHLAITGRSWVLFSDADSVLPALLHASVAAGERQDWAFSSVLFAPELALYSVLAALGLGARGALAANAVVNLVLLYAALRTVAALVRPGASRAAQIAGAVAATAAFDGLTLLDSSPAWDSLELPSLLATTTYYSATVLAAVLAAGLVAALLGTARRPAPLAVALGGLTAVSAWTNPLFLAWAVLPLALLAVGWAVVRSIGLRQVARVLGPLAAGAAAGLAARIPFSALLVRDPVAYANPDGALLAVGYTVRLLADRTATSAGVASLLAAVALLAAAAVLTVRWSRTGRIAPATVAAFGFVAPAAALLGSIALGAAASRYLQPVFFAPVLLLTLVPLPARVAGLLADVRVRRAVVAAGAAVALAAAVALVAVAARPDPAIRCVDDWITASGRTGAGLFQTIRGPKAGLVEPARLVQVDQQLRAEPWLTNRADYAVRSVSFLVIDSATPAFAVPSSAPAPQVVRCGRYRILDYGAAVLPVLPAGPIAPPKPPPAAPAE